MKTPPCTDGKKHAWAFVHNVNLAKVGLYSASFTLRGLYQCEVCKRKKHGTARHAT